MSEEPGLRERKKQRTRELLANTARRLFAERGFESVTVAQIARAAEVSEATVFNYFPAKEDLVYWRMENFEEELLQVVRDRDSGESVLAAFERFLLAQRGLLGRHEPEAREHLTALTRMIAESPALRARERRVLADLTASLAALIATEAKASADDIRPWVAASAMMGVHRALIDYTRRRILAGELGPSLPRDVRAQAKRSFAMLEAGLSDYAVKR
jgi:AcrR family transcriptional regulator